MNMQADITRQAEDMLKAAKEARIPEQVQKLAAEGVANSRKAYDTASAATLEQAKSAEKVMSSMQSGAKTISEKIIANTASNTEEFFEAAGKFAKANTLPEAMQLQADFIKSQMAKVMTQTQELFALKSDVAKLTFADVQASAEKAASDKKKNR